MSIQKTFKVYHYTTKTITEVSAASIEKAAAAVLGVETVTRQMDGSSRSFGDGKGKLCRNSVRVWKDGEEIPEAYSKLAAIAQ